VLKASFQLQNKNFKVLEDLPQEIIERRRKQMTKLKEAKKTEPDKLYINGKFMPT